MPRHALVRLCLVLSSRHRRLAALFYALSGGMSWEQRAVAAGRLSGRRHSHAGSRLPAVRYRLRRGIHRLEKGLIATPPRVPYGLDYIASVVGDMEELVRSPAGNETGESTIGWGFGVLDNYFDRNLDTGHPVVLEAHRCYRAYRDRHPFEPAPRCSPFLRPASAAPVTCESLLALANQRRSVRHYLDRPVPREAIDRAIAVGLEAPSGCNRQPFLFRVFDDPLISGELAELPTGYSGFEGGIPCLIVVVGEMCAFEEDRDRHLIYIDAALAAMGFQLALETQGLSSCCINWPSISEREAKIRDTLDLRADQQVVMLLSVGYPDPEHPVPGSRKKTLDEMRTFNQR